MVMIELSESEKPRALLPPNFSAPFTSPSLRWACKRRLRCFHPEAALRHSPSPSPDRSPGHPPPSLDTDAPHPRVSGVTAPFPKRSPARLPYLSLSPPPPPARARILIRLPSPRSEDEDGGEPLEAAPDLSSMGVSGDVRGMTDVASRQGSDAVGIGWLLRSAVRHGEEKGKKRRRVELWVSLSRDEIEEDFLWMTGAKPPRRARRRERGASDDFLMGVFPGSWMPNRVTVARYRVSEPSDTRKD